MKKYLLSLITLTFFLCEASFTGGGMAFADDSGTCGTGVTWTYTTNNKKLTISGSGAMNDYSTSSSQTTAPWKNYVSDIKSITIANTITKIGNYAFYKCANCTTVTYSSTSKVETIGNYAYAECTSLTSITVPTTVTSIGTYAYYNCSSAKSLTMNNKAGISMTIGSNAFKACGFNSSITIPAKVTSIAIDAFYNCTSLQKVTFSSSSPLTTIGTYLFEGCSSLTSVTLPPLLTEIPGSTFMGCTSLTTVTIPASVTTVANTAFYGCTNLTTIHAMPDAAPTVSSAWSTITPASITLQLYSSAAKTSYSGNDKWNGFNISTKKSDSCGASATWELDFENGKLSITGSGDMSDYTSSSLAPWVADTAYVRSISIAKTITKIGNYAFYKHARCTSVSFVSTSTVSAIGDYAFKGCKGLTSISLPTSLLTIGTYAFQSCTGLTSISLPSKITSVGNYAYDGCSNATSLTIGYNSNSSRTIGDYAFQNCSKVSSITIPTCVTAIGQYAFNGCSNATTLTFNSTSKVATIGGYAFKGCEKITSVAIPASVTSIGNEVFWNCFALKSATFDAASTLTSIGTWTFDQCSALTTVTLPPLLESIPENTFNGCSALEILVLPATVASITSSSFTKCSSLKTIIANRSTHPTLSGAVTSLTNFTPANVRVAVFSNAAKLDYSGDTYWSAFDIDTKIEGECGASGDNIKYALDLATGVLTLTGSGAMATYSTSDRAPWYQYRSIITSVVVGSGITGIGAYAFKDCANITTASFPTSLSTIGNSAFDGCSTSNFTSYSYAGSISQWLNITFGNSNANPMNIVKKCYLDGNSSPVATLVIPNGTTAIKDYAFVSCSSLTSITLPNTLTSVGSSAFSACTNISSVNYLGTITDWCNIDFDYFTSNPAYYCHSLKIGGETQTSVVLDDDLVQIKNYVFYGNTTLELISLNHSTTIATDALTNCTADIIVRGQMSGECGTDVTWTLEDGVLTISGEGEMSDYLTTGTSPWYSVRSAITKLVVEEGVTTLGEYAFKNLTNLVQVYLSKDVTTIKNYAFYGCSSISYIVSGNATPPAIIDAQTGYSGGAVYGSNVFTSVPTAAVIYVPAGSTTTYSTAQTYSHNTSSGWKCFSNFLPYTGTCGATGNEANVTWTFDPADNSMTISGTGAMYDYNNATAAPWNALKPTIAAVIIEDGITKCGKYTFSNCTALTSISLPASCNSFGTYTFSECTALTAVTIPEGLTTTGSWMFHGCTNLVNVTLPSTLTEVDVRTFSQTGITSIDIPEGVTNIDNYAFFQCASLASVGIPSTLARVSSSAFEDCSSLASIDLPEGLTYIGSEAFAGCSSLASITIPRTVTTVYTSSGSYTFQDCSALRTVNWNAEACADFNKYNSGSGFTYYTPFGNAKTTITAINFGEHVRIIPSCLCQGMTALTSVSLPASVQQIHQDAFNGCTGLTSITIPANVTTMQGTVFEGCTNITSVTTNAATPPTIQTSTFPTAVESAATLYVPATVASRTAYTNNTYWREFAHMLPYIISFNMKDHGDAIDPICVNAGRVDVALKPADPTEDYYTFGGWYVNADCTIPFTFGDLGTTVDKDTTLYAKWTIYNYQVTFDLQGHGDAIDPQTINHGELASEPSPAPTTTGYAFGGWYKEAGCSNAWDFSNDHITAATTLYAKWTINSYDVTFDLQGHGDPIAPQSINYNDLVSEPSAPSEDSYTFGGWFKEAGCSNAWDFGEDKVTDDLILYAKWTLNGLALDENANNASLLAAYDGQTTNVTMTRSLTNAQYNTFCLPFSLSASQMATTFGAGYDLEELTDVTYDGEELLLEFAQRDALEAGKPYLLQPVNNVVNPSFSDVEIDASTPSDGLDNTYIEFHGVYSPTELEGGNRNLLFLGAGNELFWPESTGNIKGFRAYFVVKGSAAKAAKRARIVKKEDTATGIETIANDQSPITNKIIKDNQLLILRDGKTYNAQGMLVE